jgi:hypothetical protein
LRETAHLPDEEQSGLVVAPVTVIEITSDGWPGDSRSAHGKRSGQTCLAASRPCGEATLCPVPVVSALKLCVLK